MKTYNQINDKIASGKAVVLTAEEMKDYTPMLLHHQKLLPNH